jgi:hypothetical protein
MRRPSSSLPAAAAAAAQYLPHGTADQDAEAVLKLRSEEFRDGACIRCKGGPHTRRQCSTAAAFIDQRLHVDGASKFGKSSVEILAGA